MINIGERIREIRKEKNFTANWLANQIGVAQSFISGIENGTKKCSLETLDGICNALGLTLSDFFAKDKPGLEPDLRQLLDAATRLTPKERKSLTSLLIAILETRDVNG